MCSLPMEHEMELYKYIWGVLNNMKCKLYRINSMPDHIHILSDLHPTICLAEYVKQIKVASSIWMKENKNFKLFNGWQTGYGAFTYSDREKQIIIDYIKNQKEHHKTETYMEEYRRLLKENGVEYDEKYLL